MNIDDIICKVPRIVNLRFDEEEDIPVVGDELPAKIIDNTYVISIILNALSTDGKIDLLLKPHYLVFTPVESDTVTVGFKFKRPPKTYRSN